MTNRKDETAKDIQGADLADERRETGFDPFSSASKKRAWESAMEVIRNLGEDPDEIVREATNAVELKFRLQQLLEANKERLEHQDWLRTHVQKLEWIHRRDLIFVLLGGLILGTGLGGVFLNWLLS